MAEFRNFTYKADGVAEGLPSQNCDADSTNSTAMSNFKDNAVSKLNEFCYIL